MKYFPFFFDINKILSINVVQWFNIMLSSGKKPNNFKRVKNVRNNI